MTIKRRLRHTEAMVFLLAFLASVGFAVANPTTIPLTFPNGGVIQVELARTSTERATGLMGRPSLPSDRGMLFVFEEADLHFFWMKDTLLPLDMIWLDQDKRILHIEKKVPPCVKDPCPVYGSSIKSLYVLEVNAGFVKKNDLKVGMVLRFKPIR